MSDLSPEQHKLVRKVNVYLLPLFYTLALFCYFDRTNLSYAALQLEEKGWYTKEVHGTGSGIFYIGYAIGQIPSNYILCKVGAPLWLAIIAAAWGLNGMCFALMNSPQVFYMLRITLGIIEGGTYPGMICVENQYYRQRELGVPIAIVLAGSMSAGVLGGPIAGAILMLHGLGGIQGWQYLFIIEGALTIILSVFIYLFIPKSPLTAYFLNDRDKQVLMEYRYAEKNLSDDQLTEQQQEYEKNLQIDDEQQKFYKKNLKLQSIDVENEFFDDENMQNQFSNSNSSKSSLLQQQQQQQQQQQDNKAYQQYENQPSFEPPILSDDLTPNHKISFIQNLNINILQQQNQQNKYILGLIDWRVWYLATMSLLNNCVSYAMIYWSPLLIQAIFDQSIQLNDTIISVMNTVPALFCIISMIAIAWIAKRINRMRILTVFFYVLTGVFLGITPFIVLNLKMPIVGFVVMALASGAVVAPFALIISWPALFLEGKSFAAGVTLYSCVSCLGGFFGNFLLGIITTDQSEDHVSGFTQYNKGFYLMAGIAVFCALLVQVFPVSDRELQKNCGSEEEQSLLSEVDN